MNIFKHISVLYRVMLAITTTAKRLILRAQSYARHMYSLARQSIQSQINTLTPREIVQKPTESKQAYKGRLAKLAIRFYVHTYVIMALATGVRIGIYTVTLRELYGTGIYTLQITYFATALIANIAMGVLADSTLGRRTVFTIGCISFFYSYLCHSGHIWALAIVGEIFYGFGEACITGILGGWLRHVLEHQKGDEFRKYYRKAAFRAFGIRYTLSMFAAITAGSLLPAVGASRIWGIGALISLVLLITVYRRLYWRYINLPAKRRSIWTTLRRSVEEVTTNRLVRQYYIMGCTQYAVWSLLAITWYASFASTLPKWLPVVIVAGICSTFNSVGSLFAHYSEKKSSYQAPSIAIPEGSSKTEQSKLLAEAQMQIDLTWMRWSHLVGGVIILIVSMSQPIVGIILFLLSNMTRGVFQKKFAGSINQSISDQGKKYSTTILSIYETFGSLSRLGMSILGSWVERSTPDGTHTNFAIAGLIMLVSGSVLGWESVKSLRRNISSRIQTRRKKKNLPTLRGEHDNTIDTYI